MLNKIVKGALSASKKATGTAGQKAAPSISDEMINILPKKEATKNLNKFVKPSVVKQRVFHGSNVPEGIVEDKQFAHYGPGSSEIHWFSESPKHANEYTYKYLESEGDQGAIFPVNLRITKPVDLPFNMNQRADRAFKDHIRKMGIYPSEIEEWAELNDLSKPSKVWQFVNTPVFREIAQRRGFDGIKAQERDFATWGAFEPTQIKSQFNRGTYDVQDPDPGFAGGGAVKGTLAALRKEFAARSALSKAADAADAMKHTRDIQPRAPLTPEQIEAEMRRQALERAPEQRMLQGFYRGFAGEGGAAPDVFVTPQKRVADYYAQKRAGQTGLEPHAEMVLADPFAGRAYGHSTPGTGKQEPLFTRARKMKESDVVDRTPLYAKGGSVAMFDKGGRAEKDKGGGAAFGVFPQMRPRRSKQDPEAAKNVPVDLARGFVAGTLGMPGDIESLIRMLPGLDESTTFLPTSEDIEKRIPFKSDTPVSRAATGLGILGGGAYTGPGSAARAITSVPGAIKRAGMDFARAAGQPAVNVVKPEGGNWLKGAVQRGTSSLKQYDLPDLFPEIGTPPPNTPENEAINKWIGSNLGNYLQKQMATPSDPVRKLAEEGITHLPDLENRTASFPFDSLQKRRSQAGFPEFGMGQSELAKKWENLADESIYTHRAGDIQQAVESGGKLDEAKAAYSAKVAEIDAKMAERMASNGFNEDEAATMLRVMSPKQKAEIVGDEGFYAISRDYERASIDSQGPNAMIAKDNPWIAKLDPDAPAYHGDVYDLGFDHVIDVLKEDLATGRIRPEQLNKVSVEQAVRRTYEYDLEKAKQMAEAQIKATEGMPTYKEYPEGFRWIELKAPDVDMSGIRFEKVRDGVRAFDAEGNRLVSPAGYNVFANEEQALMQLRNERARKPLEEALKYEGETMGHCVGGYCPDVMEGRSRIFSLRDAKGEPHVTVEVEPHNPNLESLYAKQNLPELYAKYSADRNKYFNSWPEFLKAEAPELLDATANKIVQIKGKQNRKPNEQYLPFVQDFVKSGEWSDVGDFANTGLYRTDPDSDLALKLKAAGREVPRYLNDEDLTRLTQEFPPEGYMAGGSVKAGVKEGVNLARRSLFGLKPSQDTAGRELAPVQRELDKMQAELNKAEKVAPKVEERTVSIDPGKGSAKVTDTIQKVASTPVSRRTVLKSATGQVLQSALPAQSFADLLKPVEVAKQAAKVVAPTATPFGMPGMIAAGLREGMSEDDVAKMILGTYRTVTPEKVERTVGSIKDPSSMAFEEPVGAGRAMMELIGTEGPPIANRGALRYMRHIDPAKYDELRQTAKDIAEYGFED